ncbi:MAG TPA: hypothetical protein VGL83_17355 [Stellaceae bacterium]
MAEIVSDTPPQAPIAAIRRRLLKRDLALTLLLAVLLAASAGWLTHRSASATATAWHAVGIAQDDAEHAIYIGGIVLERNRHVVAGAVLGCVAGAALGAGAAAIIGLVTAGAGFAAIPAAATAGCALTGAGGGALGRPLDDFLNS